MFNRSGANTPQAVKPPESVSASIVFSAGRPKEGETYTRPGGDKPYCQGSQSYINYYEYCSLSEDEFEKKKLEMESTISCPLQFLTPNKNSKHIPARKELSEDKKREYANFLLNCLTCGEEKIKIKACKAIKSCLSCETPTNNVARTAKRFGNLFGKAQEALIQMIDKATFQQVITQHQKNTQEFVRYELREPNNLVKIKTLIERINSSQQAIEEVENVEGEGVNGVKKSDFESFSYQPIEFPDEFKPIPQESYSGWGLKFAYNQDAQGNKTLILQGGGNVRKYGELKNMVNNNITHINGTSIAEFIKKLKTDNREKKENSSLKSDSDIEISDMEYIVHFFRTTKKDVKLGFENQQKESQEFTLGQGQKVKIRVSNTFPDLSSSIVVPSSVVQTHSNSPYSPINPANLLLKFDQANSTKQSNK